MARPRNPDLKPKTFRIRQKNYKTGGYDIYDRTSIFDPDLGKKRHISSKLVGRLPPGETDLAKMVPVDASARKSNRAAAAVSLSTEESTAYPLDVVLFVMIMATINAQDSCRAIAAFWEEQRSVFSRFINDFPECGISPETLRRIIMLLENKDARQLSKHLADSLMKRMHTRIAPIEGSPERAGVKNDETGRCALTVLNTDNELRLEQILVEAGENEIAKSCGAIVSLHLEGAVVTGDALAAQKKFCSMILEKGADYCMALNASRGNLFEKTQKWFSSMGAIAATTSETFDDGHGHNEKRSICVLPASAVPLNQEIVEEWPGLADGCLVKVVTESKDSTTGKVSSRTRFFAASLHFDERHIAQCLARVMRNHWKVEDNLHWRLDATFPQDQALCRNALFLKGKAALNKLAFTFLSKVQPRNEETADGRALAEPAPRARCANLEEQLEMIRQFCARAAR